MHPDDEEIDEPTTVTLEGPDGETLTCEVIEIFELDGQEYALLLREFDDDDAGDEDDDELIAMRLVHLEDDEVAFEPIADDDEFERVRAHLEEELDAEES